MCIKFTLTLNCRGLNSTPIASYRRKLVSRKHGPQAGGAWAISGELLSFVVLAPVLNLCLGVESSW